MNAFRTTLLAAALVAIAGCQAKTPATAPTANGSAIEDRVATNVDHAMDEARRKLETENITIRKDDGTQHKAEISPTGDLIIDGKSMALTPQQRQATLDYRSHTIQIAHSGMAIGVQGAKLATKAVSEALGGLFSGHPEEIDKRMKAQAQGIKQAASALCDELPALYASQERLADAVPEFAPFRKVESANVSECKHDLEHGEPSAPVPPPAPAAPTPPRATT